MFDEAIADKEAHWKAGPAGEFRSLHAVLQKSPGQASQVDDDVTNRLRAANEKVALGGFFEWLRSVDDRPRN